MINNLSILLSVVGVFYVAIRAAVLDRTTPWFQAARPRPADPARARRPFSR